MINPMTTAIIPPTAKTSQPTLTLYSKDSSHFRIKTIVKGIDTIKLIRMIKIKSRDIITKIDQHVMPRASPVILMALNPGCLRRLRQAMAPDLVPRHILANAIALNSMAFNSARIVGPALAGVIIATASAITAASEHFTAILAEASLSFLGLGVPPETPIWPIAARMQSFAVTPPNLQSSSDDAGQWARFEIELLEVRLRPYRLQLVGCPSLGLRADVGGRDTNASPSCRPDRRRLKYQGFLLPGWRAV